MDSAIQYVFSAFTQLDTHPSHLSLHLHQAHRPYYSPITFNLPLTINQPNTQVTLATFFFIYIKLIAPHKFRSDVLVAVVVNVLWMMGGYMNTRCACLSVVYLSSISKGAVFHAALTMESACLSHHENSQPVRPFSRTRSSNILAPSLVETKLVARASAILALTFQVAHFAGLLLAVFLAFVLYGNLVG